MMAGFSVEAILGALGGTPQPLVDAIAAGKIRGAVGVVGCNNPKVKQDYGHVTLTRRLIENDILVLVTGCAAVANGKAGQMVPEAAALAGPGLRAVCEALGHPARAAHGLVRRQHPHPRPRGRPRQAPRRRHQPAAAGRCRTRVVLREGRRHRRLRRRLRHHHGPRRPAADLRQRRTSSTCSPTGSTASSARSSPSSPIRRRRRSSSAGTSRRSDAGLGLPFIEPDPIIGRHAGAGRLTWSRPSTETGWRVGGPARPDPDAPGIRIVVTGKGGVGKTTITAALARRLARDNRRVLAVDADAQMNLAAALGMPAGRGERSSRSAANTDYIDEKTGARPGEGYGGLLRLNPDVDDVVDRFGRRAPDGVRFLVMGTLVGCRRAAASVPRTRSSPRRSGRSASGPARRSSSTPRPAWSTSAGPSPAASITRSSSPTRPTAASASRWRRPASRASSASPPSISSSTGSAAKSTGFVSATISTPAARPRSRARTWIPDDELVLAAEPSVDFLFEVPGEPFLAARRGRRTAPPAAIGGVR